ncbi:hypothetical protein AB0B28_00875 [Glycomyces sp. NPDC046736]|uniref:hypothetical protein n=1 Tax=Glycomyces sp. NPDC046736 TaxID=3155615 RepID=UPI0033C99A4D
MTWIRLVPVAALLALAGCGAGDAGGGPDVGDAADTGEDVVYQGAVTVLQDQERDAAELCGAVAESYPPQCGGLPVSGWDWDAVDHEEASGVRWGMYVVTGTFDGKSLVLTEEPVPTAEIDMSEHPEWQYSEPELGDPAEDLSVTELQAMADEMAAEFPAIVFSGWADEQHGVAIVDTVLVTPELEAFAAERYPEDTVAFSAMLNPVEE